MALLNAVFCRLGNWVEFKTRAISVGSNYLEPCIIWVKVSANVKSNNGCKITSEIIL